MPTITATTTSISIIIPDPYYKLVQRPLYSPDQLDVLYQQRANSAELRDTLSSK